MTTLLADPDLALGDLLEPGDHPQRRRLAAARGPDEDHELAVGDLEIELVDGARAVAVDLADALERHSAPSLSRSSIVGSEACAERPASGEQDALAGGRRLIEVPPASTHGSTPSAYAPASGIACAPP